MALVPIVRYFNPTLIATVVGQPVAFANGEGLNMKFDVSRSLAATPDTCTVAIEGLDPTRARLMAKVFNELGTSVPGANKLIVQAGYDAAAGGLFAGDLRSLKANQQRGASLWTIATADDGGDAFTDILVPLPSTAGLTAQQMIDIAATALGLVQAPSVAAVVATQSPIKQGPFTAVGIRRASDLLDAAARRLRCRWWIRDQQLHLGARGIADPTRPAIILVGPVVGAAPVPPGLPIVAPLTEDGSGIVQVTAFMDPNLVPGGQVVYNGTAFRIEAVVHSGETRSGGVWTSRITGRAL